MTTQEPDHGTTTPFTAAHKLCRLLRELRQSAGWSLSTIERKYGMSAVVLGAYERGDRTPPLPKLEQVLGFYGYELQAVPMGSQHVRKATDIVEELRAIADQIENQNEMLAF